MGNNTRQEYSSEHFELLKKAGLLGEGIVVIRAKVSDDRRSMSKDGRNWNMNPKTAPPSTDRTNLTDYAVPVREGTRIKGYWRNRVTQEEAQVLEYDLGIPTFTYAQPGQTKDNPIKDTQVPLFDGKEYDLSDPIQKAEWDVVKHSSLVAENRMKAWSDDWCSFYYVEVEKEQEAVQLDVKEQLDFIEQARKIGREEKALVSRLMHYRGVRPIEDYARANESLLEMMFDSCILSMPEQLKVVIALRDKPMYLKLYQLIEHGRVEKYGTDGPYHVERTNAAQERGRLLGNTTEEAVLNLKATDNIYLLSFLDNSTQTATSTGVVRKENSLEAIRKKSIETMSEAKAKNMTKEQLSAWLQSVGEEVLAGSTVAQLRDHVMDVLEKEQEKA
jgi:hypothetical protein